jgi:hypothetical protein
LALPPLSGSSVAGSCGNFGEPNEVAGHAWASKAWAAEGVGPGAMAAATPRPRIQRP